MKYWQRYQIKTKDEKVNPLLEYFYDKDIKTIVELGCGGGKDTVHMINMGYKVTSIDKYISESLFYPRIKEEYKNNLTLIESDFENVILPKSDLVMSFFSLPFCKKSKFKELLNKIYDSLNDKGYIALELFGDRDEWSSRKNIITLKKEEVLEILSDYELIKFEEVEYVSNKKWHFYDIIARKK